LTALAQSSASSSVAKVLLLSQYPLKVYSACPTSDLAGLFSGQGAKDWGGRWNSRGVPVVYTAPHRSLSILEILVHVKGGAGIGSAATSTPFYVYTVSFDTTLLEELPISSLPAGWNSAPPTATSQSLGDAWVGGRKKPRFGCAQRYCS
jgi:RES domain-containing protein